MVMVFFPSFFETCFLALPSSLSPASALHVAPLRLLPLVTNVEIEESFDRLKVGNKRSSANLQMEEKTVTAFHEGGHALMTLYSSHANSLHKASILFRGEALGVTWQTEKAEKYTERFGDFFDQLKILLAGKAAEELQFGVERVSTGCLSDLQKATQMARHLALLQYETLTADEIRAAAAGTLEIKEPLQPLQQLQRSSSSSNSSSSRSSTKEGPHVET
ncbi:hypothetical protein Esti_000553 [Eimeria stiedai]